MSAIQRFFGFGGGLVHQQTHNFGDGQNLHGMGQIAPELMGQIGRFREVSFQSTTPEQAIEDEKMANQLQAEADVYSSRLRANAKAAAAYGKAAIARLNHDVQINQVNAQLVAAQTRAVASHARIGFKNGLAAAGAQGAVAGYTGENNNVFKF